MTAWTAPVQDATDADPSGSAASGLPDQPSRRPRRRGPGVGRHTSVVVLLVVLTMIPTLGLPVFSWSFVHDRLERARTASRVEQGLEGVAHIDALRTALETESYGQALFAFIQGLKLTPAQRAALPERLLDEPAGLRVVTDRALVPARKDALVAIPGGRAQMASLLTRLAAVRKLALAGSANPTLAIVSLVGTLQKYDEIQVTLQGMERTAIDRIANGRLGTGSAGLLQSVAQIRAVGDLALQASVQHTQLMNASTGTSLQKSALATSTGAVAAALQNLGRYLSDANKSRLAAILADPYVLKYQSAVDDFITKAGEISATTNISQQDLGYIFDSGAGAIELGEQISDLLNAAIGEGVTQARHDRNDANARARNGIIGAVGTLVVTIIALLFVGGLIRSGLRDLAGAAQRLSAGRFELMDVKGPREVALASEGLNDAVHGLREITMKAGLIAQGDLAAPALEVPSPGPLGAALHASFERVVEVMREREILQHQLAHDATTHDALTGLPNRAEAEVRLQDALHRARTGGTRIALLFVDLDHFKRVNDTYGHHAGDHVLCESAVRMGSQVRGTDLVCRLGGDEFVVILSDITVEAAAATGERIVASVRESIRYRDQDLRVGASVGIAVWPDVDDSEGDHQQDDASLAEDLLNRADKAVYRAKAADRNAAVF